MAITPPTVEATRTIAPTLNNALPDDGLWAAFINTAVMSLEQLAGFSSYSEALQTEITKYYAAHIAGITIGDAGIKTSKSLGDASESQAADAGGTGILSTVWGRIAAMLDTKGLLSNLGKKSIVVSILP